MKRSRPAGKSLIEMLVMISILSIVLGLSATSLATLFRLRYTITRDTELARSIERLSTRLRTDAHEAASVSLSENCNLTLRDGRTIRYSFAAPRIVREVRDGNKTIHHDSFSLPRHSKVAFASEPFGTSSLLRIVIAPDSTTLPPRELPRAASIEAAVGIHASPAKSEGQP
jgi:type II secretory pathway component PulJ